MLTDFIKAISSGILEGLTEFIPVSSTAHLLLFSFITEFSAIKNNLFEIVIQLGAILAVVVIYRKKLFGIIINFKNKNSQHLLLNLFLAFLPAAIIGFLFHHQIKELFFSVYSIAIALIGGGIIMIIVDRKNYKSATHQVEKISPRQALAIGFFQILAMIPGTSRSGATIIGGLLSKLDRKTAAEFSFLLSVPIILAASLFDLYKNYADITSQGLELIIAGFIAAFISALVVIKWFINYVSKHNFIPFAIYRIILGIVILVVIL